MNGDYVEGSITFKADIPADVINRVLENTKEDMDKWLATGNTFDLSDGADRTVTYISFPSGTKPEDVASVVHTEWIKKEIITTGFVQKVCKKCGQPQLYLRTTNEGVFFRCFDDVNYCPNCGAKFRVRKEGENG